MSIRYKGFNNPLNIRATRQRWQGSDGSSNGFVNFNTISWCIRAAIKILITYVTKYHIESIEDIITRWAPPSDGNDTDLYIKFVVRRMPDFMLSQLTPINRHTHIVLSYPRMVYSMLACMCLMESNFSLPYSVFEDAWNSIQDERIKNNIERITFDYE